MCIFTNIKRFGRITAPPPPPPSCMSLYIVSMTVKILDTPHKDFLETISQISPHSAIPHPTPAIEREKNEKKKKGKK